MLKTVQWNIGGGRRIREQGTEDIVTSECWDIPERPWETCITWRIFQDFLDFCFLCLGELTGVFVVGMTNKDARHATSIPILYPTTDGLFAAGYKIPNIFELQSFLPSENSLALKTNKKKR